MSALLSAEKLELAYGQVAVCRDISIHVEQGEVVALIGANGAGKSTTLRAIAGLLPPRHGSIVFRGRDVTAMPSYERSKLGIALVPEGRHVFPFLTVRENLELGGFKNRNDGAKIRRMIGEIFDMFPRLAERSAQNAGTLERWRTANAGSRPRHDVGAAIALSRRAFARPRTDRCAGYIPHHSAINATGTSVLLVEQNARYALETASRGYVLQTGSVIASGTCADLKQNPRVQEAYLGRIATAVS